MSEVQAPKRLAKVATELNQSKEAVFNCLTTNGFIVENNPNAKITSEQYNFLIKEFANSPLTKSFTRREEVKLNSLSELSILKNEQPLKHNTFPNRNWVLGKIKSLKKDKGYGFIISEGENEEYFFHFSNFNTGIPEENEYCVYKLITSKKKKANGKYEAINLYQLNKFDRSPAFLETELLKSKTELLKTKIIEILSVDSIFKVIETTLREFPNTDEKEQIKSLAKSLNFIIKSLTDVNLKDGIIKLIKEWASIKVNPQLQIQLWDIGLAELPSTTVLIKAFSEVDDGIKTKIINSIPIGDKIIILNQYLNSGLLINAYYKNLFAIIKSEITNLNFIVFDIEYDGHSINEIAYTTKDKIESTTKNEEIEKFLEHLKNEISNPNAFITGHNIINYDLPILANRIAIPNDVAKIDTLTIETLLSPTLKSYALKTSHTAKKDVEKTLDLLINQIIRLLHISEELLKKFENFLELNFIKLIYQLRENIKNRNQDLYSFLETERNKFFVSKEIGNEKVKEFKDFLDEKRASKVLIVAPKEFHPLLAELPNIQFSGDGSDYSKMISKEKVSSLPNGMLEKYLLESFIEKCETENKVPIYVNLPSRIKILISENATTDFITEETTFSAKSENHFCVSPDKLVEIIPRLKESNRSVILLESDLISVTEKTLLKTLDYTIFQQRLNNDSFWIHFTGGQSRVEITREDLKKLKVENVAEHFELFWIEKTSLDTFQVWGSFDFKKYLKNEFSENNVFEFAFNRKELEKENCKYVIPKGSSGKLSITRYNPESRYRDRYWTFQTKLIKDIISSNRHVVLIINQEKEKQKLYDYFISQEYFVPELSKQIPIHTQIRIFLDHSKKNKLLIITKDKIPEIILSEDLNGFNFIIDSFELEEKWFISKGTGFLAQAEKTESGLKFKNDDSHKAANKEDDDDDDEKENSIPISSSHDVFVLLKIQKPIIDYYRWLFHSTDKNSTVWLTDSRLGDFAGLEEEWKATKKFISVWSDDAEYEADYKTLKTYFPSPKPKEEIKLDVEATKKAMREIFLKEDSIIHNWFPYQHDFLNEILPAEKDILVTLPTGGGKSILFQAPSLYRGSISGRLTIVVTPLKALMEDHVNKLWELNFFGSVDCINRDRKDTQHIYRRIAGGEILLLYITPERFRSKAFINALKMRLENDGGLEYAVYDEAHCVSQWGLDFRPDYLNSANVNIALKGKSNSKFPLLLFSATVSEQIYNDFQSRFNNSINRLENYSTAYNPLREHIAIGFESSEDANDKLTKIAEALHNANFNIEKSRCLVFVRRRKDAEENVQELERKLNEVFGGETFTGRVAYFHAGMNGEERQEVYNSYKSGETYILLATKAFGMGMDIPNIHYVYHFGPSGTLEDYLQEVGRAGRNAKQLEAAGFINDKKIETKCFYEKDDFKKIKTLLQNGRITWANLLSVYSAVVEYYSKFRNFETQNDKPIVLPFNILSQTSAFDNIHDRDQLLRLSLYWLEKLERIKLGFYAPGQLEFSEFIKPPDSKIENEEQRKLITEIEKEWNQKNETTEAISIELNKLLTATELSNSSDLLKLIFKCQKKNIFHYENELIIYPTKKKMDELKHFNDGWREPNYPTLEAVYDLSRNLMEMTTEKQQFQFEGSVLEEQKRIISGEYFNENHLPWCVKTDANGNTTVDEKRIQKEQKDFERNKVKFAFTLADFIPKVRHQTLISHKLGQKPKIVQVIYNGCKEREDWKKFLKDFKKDLIALLKHVTKNFIAQGNNGKRYNASKLVIDLGLEEKNTDYIENLLSFANWLGYLHYEGTFLPMGVEMYLQSKKEIRHEESNSLDKQIHEEFETTQKLRELRLIALECLSGIETKQEKDKFITDYFGCDDSGKIIALLINHLGKNHEVLKAFRDEALKSAYEELSEEQQKVYDEAISKNVQVIAGPGSGKTHTLILRVARLIHTENIRPENILVLAYNRAVVVELKERLTKLFSSLGYANIIGRLKVFTFHGFCKFSLRESIRNLEFAQWIPIFIDTAKNQPGLISNQLGVISHVFVDEFQDITNERLELLKLIANPKNTFTTVIGDPNQSIYGYERVNEGGSRSPKDNYKMFASIYNPSVLHLSQNYRSYPAILTLAEKVIARNDEKFGITSLVPIKKTEVKNYCEIIDWEKTKVDWLIKLKQILDEPHSEKPNEKFQQVAIMFRSNREIYRAYNKIQNENVPNIRLRIQGESEQFTRIREIAWVLDFYKSDLSKPILKSLISDYRLKKAEVIEKFPNWDKYHLDFFECLLLEFNSQIEDEATQNDLIDFIEEVSQKDDGQLSKIYYKHYREVNPNERKTEVVLTTMHKVKGLEFDAVIIPPSFTNLPMIENELHPLTDAQFKEEVEEERRLLFVALTRARYRLVFLVWKREQAILTGQRFSFPPETIQRLGVPIQTGFDKFFISWGAKQFNFNNYFENIEKNIKQGNAVSINKRTVNHNGNTWVEWMLKANTILFGRLVQSPFDEVEHESINGFSVSGIYRYTFQDTVEYDSKHGTNYSNAWCPNAIAKGYIYLIEFSGYGEVV